MNDKWVAGIIGGLAEYYNQDALLFRLLFILFLVFTGLMPGVLIYGIAWFLIPSDDGAVEYTIVDEAKR